MCVCVRERTFSTIPSTCANSLSEWKVRTDGESLQLFPVEGVRVPGLVSLHVGRDQTLWLGRQALKGRLRSNML
jgi:hypothetical protein